MRDLYFGCYCTPSQDNTGLQGCRTCLYMTGTAIKKTLLISNGLHGLKRQYMDKTGQWWIS